MSLAAALLPPLWAVVGEYAASAAELLDGLARWRRGSAADVLLALDLLWPRLDAHCSREGTKAPGPPGGGTHSAFVSRCNHAFATLCRGGRAELAAWFARHFAVSDAQPALLNACVAGSFSTAAWLRDAFGARADADLLRQTCLNGHASLVAWLCGDAALSRSERRSVFCSACKAGLVALGPLLAREWGLSVRDVRHAQGRALRLACAAGEARTVEWLLARFGRRELAAPLGRADVERFGLVGLARGSGHTALAARLRGWRRAGRR